MWKPFNDSNSIICFEVCTLIWWINLNQDADQYGFGILAIGTVLKVVLEWLILIAFSENIISCTCLDKSGLKIIFHLHAHSEIFSYLYLVD